MRSFLRKLKKRKLNQKRDQWVNGQDERTRFLMKLMKKIILRMTNKKT